MSKAISTRARAPLETFWWTAAYGSAGSPFSAIMVSSTRAKSVAVFNSVPSRSNRTHWVALDSASVESTLISSVQRRTGEMPQIIDVNIGLQRIALGQGVVMQSGQFPSLQITATTPGQQF